MYDTPEARRLRGQIRFWMSAFLIGLVVSGVTAFPLVWEIQIVARMLGLPPNADPADYSDLRAWIALVQEGLLTTDARYPFMAYGTDWLAFGHLCIAVLFVDTLKDPVRNVWLFQSGLAICALVIPLALICGPLRGIPFYWQMIDSSFGVAGAFPLALCLHLTRRIEALHHARTQSAAL